MPLAYRLDPDFPSFVNGQGRACPAPAYALVDAASVALSASGAARRPQSLDYFVNYLCAIKLDKCYKYCWCENRSLTGLGERCSMIIPEIAAEPHKHS